MNWIKSIISFPRLCPPAWHVVVTALCVNLGMAFFMTQGFAVETVAKVRLVAFGDSLTAGYLLKPDQSFPAQLEAALVKKGYAVEITNSGVSGDTTAAALDRFDWAIPAGTEAVILELGANDALRGMSPKDAKANLDKILTQLKAKDIAVLIAGMRAPKNWGEDYAIAFDAIFTDLAAKHAADLYPFFLDGVALDPALNLDDGMHPNGKGVGEIVNRMLPAVEKLLNKVIAGRATAPTKS